MKPRFKIGIDLSIRSTGITIISDDDVKFIIVSDKYTKKVENRSSEYIILNKWDRCETSIKDTIEKERVKSYNIYNISNKIISSIDECICGRWDLIDGVRIEGISFGSSNTTSIIELSGLNFIIRYKMIEKNVPISIIPPTQLKKFAVGNGAAVKDDMIEAFCRLFPYMRDEHKAGIKIDDIADAYFLGMFEL